MLTRSKERLCTLILRSGSATERERPHINVFEKTNKNFHNLSTTNKLNCKLISTQSNEKKIGKPPSSRVVLKIPSGIIQNLEDKDVKLEEKQVRSKGKMSKLEEFAWKKFACMDSSKSKILSKEEIVDLWSERECILSLFSEEESSISNNFKDFVEMLVESKTERSGLLNVVEFSELLKKFVKHLESKLRDESSYKRAKSTRAFQNINSSTGQQLKVLSAKIHNRLPNYLQNGLQTLSISNKKIPSILNQSHENLKKNTMQQQNPFHVQFKVRASSAFSNKNNNNNNSNYHNITQEQNGRINLDISSQSSSKTIDHNNEQSIFNDRVLLTSESQRQKKVPILKIQKILHPTLGLTSHLQKQTDKQIHYQNSNYKRYQIADARRNTNNFYNNNTGDSCNESQGNNENDAFTKSSVDQMFTEPDQNQNLIQSNSSKQEQQQYIHQEEDLGQQEQQTAEFVCTFKPSDLLSQCWNYQSNRSSHFSLEKEQKRDSSRYFNFEENMRNIDFNDALDKISIKEDRSNNAVVHQTKRKNAPLLLDSCKKKLGLQNENENEFLLSSSSSSKQNSNFMLPQQQQQQYQQQQNQTIIGIRTQSLTKFKNKNIQQQQQSQDQNQFREIQPKRMFGEKIDLNCTKFFMKKEVRVVQKRLFKKSPIKQVTTEMRNDLQQQQQQQQQLSRITGKNNINSDLNDNSLLFDNLNILVDITPDDNSATPQSHNFNLNS